MTTPTIDDTRTVKAYYQISDAIDKMLEARSTLLEYEEDMLQSPEHPDTPFQETVETFYITDQVMDGLFNVLERVKAIAHITAPAMAAKHLPAPYKPS